MNSIKVFLITIAGLTTLLYSCKHEPLMAPGTPEVCFDSQIMPVIQSGCAKSGCHNGSGEAFSLLTYNEIVRQVDPGKPLNSELYKVITANPHLGSIMPPKPNEPLTSAQIDNIEIWILQGANPTTCTVECDTVNVTFTGSILPINDTYCKGCHSGSSPSGGITLADYASIKASVDGGRYIGAIEHFAGYKAMPKDGSKLPDCNIYQINKWIKQGMPNN